MMKMNERQNKNNKLDEIDTDGRGISIKQFYVCMRNEGKMLRQNWNEMKWIELGREWKQNDAVLFKLNAENKEFRP